VSTISIHLPESLHEQARVQAAKDSISVEQLLAQALAEKLSALQAQDYLLERARRGDPEKYRQALSKVPDVEPEEYDRF
jgi:hypothetical protein